MPTDTPTPAPPPVAGAETVMVASFTCGHCRQRIGASEELVVMHGVDLCEPCWVDLGRPGDSRPRPSQPATPAPGALSAERRKEIEKVIAGYATEPCACGKCQPNTLAVAARDLLRALDAEARGRAEYLRSWKEQADMHAHDLRLAFEQRTTAEAERDAARREAGESNAIVALAREWVEAQEDLEDAALDPQAVRNALRRKSDAAERAIVAALARGEPAREGT